jgi:hypothetical protein
MSSSITNGALACTIYFIMKRVKNVCKGAYDQSIYEGRCSLFCSYEIHRTELLQIVFLVSLESSWRGGVHALGSMMFGLAVQKFLNIEWFSSLKIKLNCSWEFLRNWNVPLVLLERSWWAGFNGIYLVRFGFRMWEILIFKWFQINSKKPGFERKNQLRTW